MAFVDPERFKRFEQFFTRHLAAFSAAAARGLADKGPGVLVYFAPDTHFEGRVTQLRFEYKSKAEIDAMHGDTRDELIQGMLERYQPPGEALFVAIYPDHTYDISRVVLKTAERSASRPN